MVADFVKICKLFFYIQKSNVKTAFLNTGDAVVNILMMTINNLSFIFMWWVIFHNKGSINGWTFSEMALLFAVSNNAFATYALFARGIQNIPEYIANGSLDNYLVTPRSSLFMISVSESTFANWGDYLTGFIMFFLSGYVSWSCFFLMLFVSFMGFILLYALRLIVSCFAFFASDTQRLGDNMFMAFLTFGMQPASIFTGWYKILFLTIIPAGFLSLIPVRILTDFHLSDLGLMMGYCFLLLFIAVRFFYFGLKRYTSGNRFGVR